MAFDPSLNPVPPNPTPPPPSPLPPAPWPNTGGFNFSVTLSSHMVLQQAPAVAAVYGPVGSTDANSVIMVTVTPSSGSPYTVQASVGTTGRWKALLRPTASSANTYAINAACSAGCSGSITLTDVVFGDVWYCHGQSNMWLQMQFTYARNSSFAAITQGAYDNIRLMSGDSQSQGLSPSFPPTHPWRHIQNAAALDKSDVDALDQFSAPCYHFAEALTDQFKAAGKPAPVLGLVGMAIGGSMIEEWIRDDVAATCYGADPDANGAGLNHILWDVNVRPFLDMTIKGWLYYQGENNAGSLHGNSQYKAGYGCMMPALINSFRVAWSQVPGTTDPLAPFGIVTLSADDSEGAADMGSFRWAQSGSYGVVPNPLMPNAFMAHAYDLADTWVNCGDAPQTTQCPGCDTADPAYNCLQTWYMGPGIHPRLKKPVGQRLAASALASVYGWGGPVTGPTLSGCTYTTDASSLSLSFNTSLLAGAALVVTPYNTSYTKQSGLSILVNSTGQPGSGKWVACNIALSSEDTVSVDLAPLAGAEPQAVKYAWGATGGTPNDEDVVCCAPSSTGECVPGQCPIMVQVNTAPWGGLPANPFLAQINAGGKCVCPLPQVCDA